MGKSLEFEAGPRFKEPMSVRIIHPKEKDKPWGIQIENSGLDLPVLTKLAFFALDNGYRLSIMSKVNGYTIYSPEGLQNNLNNQEHHDRRGRVLEEMRDGRYIALEDPTSSPTY